MLFLHLLLNLALCILMTDSARILAVFPTPLISHQVHRSIIHELISRDHEVVLITPLPEYSKGESPANLMEIDVSNVTNEIWQEIYVKDDTGQNIYTKGDLKGILQVAAKVVEKQLLVPEIKSFIANNETFDLLLLDAWIRPVLFWTYVFDAPVISVSASFNNNINLGYPTHPLLYSSNTNEMEKLSFWQKIASLYDYWKINSMYDSLEKEENEMARRLFGKVAPLKEQMKRIEMFLLDVHPVWQGVRPMPRNVVQLGGTLLQERENKTELSEELKEFLNSHSYGVVYVNFGADMRPCIPKHTQDMLIRAFGMLQYPVLWKWDEDISELPNNVRVVEKEPQAEILKHRYTRLFISQCDHKSTYDAIAAAVPLIAVPLAADQWRNAELLLRHKVGTVIDIEKVTDEEFKNTIELAIKNTSYFVNMQRMSTLLHDAPASAPVRAANAIEYVLRHSAGHIVSPSLHVHWFEYMEIELFIIITLFVWFCISLLCLFVYCIIRLVRGYKNRSVQKNSYYKDKV